MTPDVHERQSVIHDTATICRQFMAGLRFVVMDSGRDPKFIDSHLLSYVSHDLIEASLAIPTLVEHGIRNVCRRELRFVIEASIKLAYIHQQDYSSDISTKLDKFRGHLDSSKISVRKAVQLSMLAPHMHEDLNEETGRLYGETSNYVHLTAVQIQERIASAEAGRSFGNESASDIHAFNLLLARGLAVALVFLFHSVPTYVAGDWLVRPDGSSNPWYFRKSRFIAAMDSHFDYKHERQRSLEAVQAARQSNVSF